MTNKVVNPNNLKINILSFVLGLTSVISQIVILRELIIVFYGNETAYAVILSGWLFWVSLGSFVLSRLALKARRPQDVLAALQILLFFLVPGTILAIRLLKLILNVGAGEIIGMGEMCLSSYAVLGPLSFVCGGVFSVICRMTDTQGGRQAPAVKVGGIYLLESLGAGIGGLLFSFVLVKLFPSVIIAFTLAGINALCVLLLSERRAWIFKTSIVLLVLLGMAFSFGMISRIDILTRGIQWKGLKIIAAADSIYGNIVITQTGSEYSIYENGLLSSTTTDDLSSEEPIHYPLLAHPNPKKVLLVGNGISGGVREILKHNVILVDYLELDPMVVSLAKKHFPPEVWRDLDDPRVTVTHQDARLFIKQTEEQYDAVIVNLADPYTAMLNRYYSQEFFKEVKRILRPGGVISLSVSSSENYLNEETKRFLRSIHTTLQKVFLQVYSLPGDTNIFIAMDDDRQVSIDPDVLIDRLRGRMIDARYVREYYIPYRLSPGRMRYIEEVLSVPGEVNTDVRPIAYLYDILLWSTHFNSGFKELVESIQWVCLKHLLAMPLVLFAGGWILKKRSPMAPINISVVTTGFSEIIFQIVIILAFQTLYGYAYYKISFIIAVFMLGLVAGALLGRYIVGNAKEIMSVFKFSQLMIVLYPLILPVVFTLFRDTFSFWGHEDLFGSIFAGLPLIAGFLGGLQYPLAVQLNAQLRRATEGEVARSAGLLYALDVSGAALGALITGVILIPLLGIAHVAILCAAVNAAVLLLLIVP